MSLLLLFGSLFRLHTRARMTVADAQPWAIALSDAAPNALRVSDAAIVTAIASDGP